MTYEQTRPWAAAIAKAVLEKTMPPWFADLRFGHFSDDPSLTEQQIATVTAWADAGAPPGHPRDAPLPRQWSERWNIAKPDIILTMPARGTWNTPTKSYRHTFARRPWNHQRPAAGVCRRDGKVCSCGIRPRLPDSLHHQGHAGERPEQHRPGVRQEAAGTAGHHFAIEQSRAPHPLGAADFRMGAQGTLPNDATPLSLFPHMHLRGKRFEYDIVRSNGSVEPLLRVNCHFHWQVSYRLAEPRLLKAGTRVRAVAWYDNSRNNPHHPDPVATVTWGDQTYQEMMVGFFDVAVPAKTGKERFFVRGAVRGSVPRLWAAVEHS